MDAHSPVLGLPNSSPSSSTTTTTIESSDSTGQDRTSSETTIFTIYSMYGDDDPQHNWATSALNSVDAKLPNAVVLVDPPDGYQDSVCLSNELSPRDIIRRSMAIGDHSHSVGLLPAINISAPPAVNGVAHPSDDRSHLNNGFADPSTSNRQRQSILNGILSTQRTIPASPQPSLSNPSRMFVVAKPSPPASRPSSMASPSSAGSLGELTSLPESRPRPHTSGRSPRNSGSPSVHRLSDYRELSPIADNRDHPLVQPPSPARLTPPKILTPSPSKKGMTSVPSSVTSLVPSEGEELDAFHVRNTYAQLDVQGVKGDGYEEGVERTRARVGVSRASQLNADQALCDANEKMRELDPKEIQALASLDRYGFFTIPSHDRLVVLTSASLSKRLAPSSGGPSRTPQAKTLTTLPPVSPPNKEPSRIEKWARMLQVRTRDAGGNIETWGIKPLKEAKLRERTYKGIPDRWRCAAWELLINRVAKVSKEDLAKLGRDYREALDKPSSYDVQIDLDVPRTISGHVMFRTRYGAGQRSLFHVLHCFSLRCPDCGYVQGMGSIAATLLCYFEPERAYASLVRLHDTYSMHTMFSPGFPGLLESIYVQERITEQMMPDVYVAFQKHTISTTSYATKWYITLFANSVPFQTQLRLWDAFLLEGHDFFITVAISIVWAHRDHITCSSANFETVLSLLSSFFVPEDEDTLLAWIKNTLGDKKLRSRMRQWRNDWKTLVATGNDHTALL